MADVLTREFGLENSISPIGRKFGVRYNEHKPSLMEICYVDDKRGELPDELKGFFTKETLARLVLNEYLRRFWEKSDSKKVG